ncbi:ATP-binding protein [Accumulibacter sp.]|uniref:ATP-binding protein n=1 Tax=Accumulibacter sp. TaxID=2053492 RepID=UPI0025E57DAE|nr:ATP-binding protein [Accumulibacter sp.]MCM8613401.1 ATP-binding protein [Accumulibacter sp.]MCM8634569.1 ATP-binding protein [Accumulibacter sp.]MCM8641653.1 ATP-binding protein [Accumulibacter sp.]
MNVRRTAYLKTIRERLRANPIVSLVGPRQAGKTTLARMLAEESAEAVHFFDLESPADLARLANPELVLRPLTGLLILDEVQRRPDLFPVLRVLADRPGTPARFLILGSASPALIKAGSESLAGRVSFVDVTGFSLAELGADALPRLWWRGGFPRAWLAPDDAIARQWLDDFRRTFLERDMPQLGIQVPAATLGRFWTMVAHYHGQVLNLAELARALGSSEPTARRYLDILSGTYVVRQLPPWFENLKKRQVRSPKVYIRDSGLLHALLGIPDPPGLQSHPKLGASWEGFCLEQILGVCGDRDAYFWGTHSGAELDLMVQRAGRRLGFEFKFSEQPGTTKSMRIALEDLALDHLYVIHPGEHEFPLDESITAITPARLIDILRSEAAHA